MNEIIAVITDAATGYRLVIARNEVEALSDQAGIKYDIDLHAPRRVPLGSMSDHFDGNLIDTTETVPVRSDGTGHIPFIESDRQLAGADGKRRDVLS